MSADSLCLIACAEAGPLEEQVKLMILSLRRWGGPLADTPIYIFSPRPGHLPGFAFREVLKDLGAKFIDEPLNPDHGHHPVDNKIFASAWAETHLSYDTIAFVDSDTVFVNPPSELVMARPQVAIRPVDQQGAGSSGSQDERDSYWQKAYQICGISSRRTVLTTMDQVQIREYWNAGLIAASRQLGFFKLWHDMYLHLAENGLRPAGWPRQLDQIALAMATGTLPGSTLKTLSPSYNYPLPLRPWLPRNQAYLGWDELVHLHYHRWFAAANFLELLTPRLSETDERYAWLEAQLPLQPPSDEIFARYAHNKPS